MATKYREYVFTVRAQDQTKVYAIVDEDGRDFDTLKQEQGFTADDDVTVEHGTQAIRSFEPRGERVYESE